MLGLRKRKNESNVAIDKTSAANGDEAVEEEESSYAFTRI